jgi:hypothetical protein
LVWISSLQNFNLNISTPIFWSQYFYAIFWSEYIHANILVWNYWCQKIDLNIFQSNSFFLSIGRMFCYKCH